MNILKNNFGEEKRWVTWKYETDKKGKKTKVPYDIKNKKADSTDLSTWNTYDEVLNASDKIGIVFTGDKNLLGIDIDHCLKGNNIEHEEKEKIVSFLIEADTYTEISPSKTGLHLFLKLTSSFDPLVKKKKPFEFYTVGRFFTVTNNSYKEEKEIRTITKEEAINLLSILGYPWGKGEINNQESSDKEMLDDVTVLKKMFSAKNAGKIKSLYGGNTSFYKDDISSADMALCSSLAFWTGRNANQMERIWLASPLGQREKTQNRKDYRDRTINACIKSCKEIYKIPSNGDIELLYTTKDEKKIYTKNTENICRVLRKHKDFAGRIRYDIFKNVLEINDKNKWRNIEENDAISFQTAISILFPCFGTVGKDMVQDAILKVAKENSMDSALDFITSLRWDGTERLNVWLLNTYGAPDDKYHRSVGSNWLKGLVKRIVDPGCKFDYVLVLEGEQGTKKSTSLSILGGSWHLETTMSVDSKDFFMQFSGKAIVEFSEGETLTRTEVKRMKAIITMQNDKYRPPYERFSQEFPRRCVFAMTTNETKYLKDETGNRRWLPVAVLLSEANVEWLALNREQLLAEAYHRVINLKETIYEFPKEETLSMQEERRIYDPSMEIIVNWYFNDLEDSAKEKGITTHEVFKTAINGGWSGKPMNTYEMMMISSILKDVLKLEKRREMQNGVRLNKWFPSKKTESMEETKNLSLSVDF